MDRQTISQCPACGSERIHKYVSAMNYYATGEAFDIYECDACGMRFTQDAPIEAEAAQYYSSPDYISHTDIRKGLFNRTYHAVRTVMLRRKAHLVMKALGSKEGRLLDIGAGTGYFAREMQRRGFAVEAVEVSEDARKVAEKNAGIKEKDISALATFENESFDAITMWHVLEHVYNLADEWQTLRRLLKNDGRLVIAVPNCASLDAKHYREFWAAYDVPRHLWHFNSHTHETHGRTVRLQDNEHTPHAVRRLLHLNAVGKIQRPQALLPARHDVRHIFVVQNPVQQENSSSLIYVMRKL